MNKNNNRYPDDTSPYWIRSSPGKEYPALDQDITADTVIIGGGLVGITAAYLLSRQGVKTALIEADRILHGTTGHTTAKVTSQHSLIYARLKTQYSDDLARQYADANQSAIDTIASIIKENSIDCDFERRPAFVYTCTDKYIKDLEDEAEAASSLGIPAFYDQRVPLPIQVKAALRFDNQAQFHPLKYLHTLADQIIGKDGHIYEKTAAVDIEKNSGYTILTRSGKKVQADKVIIATHYPFFDGGGLYISRIYQEKSYVTAVRIEEAFPEGMFISAEDPARSLRSQKDAEGELVLVGGEHHKSGQDGDTDSHYENLLHFARDTFQVKDVLYRWSTQDCMTIDGLPYTGNLTPRSPNLYVATGFGKWGMTNGTASAMILRDLIIHGDSPWAEVYNPNRGVTTAGIKTFIIQNLDVAKNWLAGKLQPMLDNAEIDTGSVQLIEVDGRKVGAYRDEQGTLHMVDTTCTHLGCELQWNTAERTWDCPCHGSRFSYDGAVVEGPAINCLHHEHQEANQIEAKIFK